MVSAASIMVTIQKRTVIFDSNQHPLGQLMSTLKSAGSWPGATLNVSCMGARLKTRHFSPLLLPIFAYLV